MNQEQHIREAAEKEYQFPARYLDAKRKAFISGVKSECARLLWQTGFPKLIIEFNPDADETQYPYTAYLDGCKGMVVQATSKEGCIQQMLISIESQMRRQVAAESSQQTK